MDLIEATARLDYLEGRTLTLQLMLLAVTKELLASDQDFLDRLRGIAAGVELQCRKEGKLGAAMAASGIGEDVLDLY